MKKIVKNKNNVVCLVVLWLTFILPTLHLSADTEKENEKKEKEISLNTPDLDKKPVKRLKRAMWEGLGHFVYATSSYWIRQDVNREDWEYQFTWEDQKKRIFQLDGFRLDSNTFSFNWTHSLAGGIYYNYARTNHLNKVESLLYAITCSFAWESLVEFREVVSVNDMIATPLGGIGFGESMFQLGRFFRSRKPTVVNRIARLLSNPIMALNEWLDRKSYKDQFAFGEGQSWNDCRLVIGPRFDTRVGENSNMFMQMGLETQLFNLPGYGEPGASGCNVKDTLFSEFNLDAVYSKKGMYQFDLYAKAVLFGHFSQSIQGSSDSQDKRGYSFFVGAGCAFDVTNINPAKLENTTYSTGPDRADKHCIINLLGPTVDLTIYRDRLKIRLAADAYADFSLIHSHAFKNYSRLYQVGVTKSTLGEHGYYFGTGITLSSLLQIDFANLEFKGTVKFHYVDSIDGMDRFQNDITPGNDFNLRDRRFSYRLSLGYHFPKTPFQLAAGLEKIDRWGTIEDFVQSSTEKRSYLQIRYLF